jgi:leucyl/phenylalanyl-tRNA--protein transferase
MYMRDQKVVFPNPRHFPGLDGIVYVGADLEQSTLVSAYRLGIFPWPVEGYPLLWHCPEERGVLDFAELHVPRRLKQSLRSAGFTISFNRAFQDVISACASQPRKGQDGTWILPGFIPAYTKFHRAGFAHSIECWQNDVLVGGLYGVYVGGVFSGESMFHLETNASKACLLAIIEKLKLLGLTWMDIQMVTPVTRQFGGKYISRNQFLDRIEAAQKAGLPEKLSLV